MSTILEGKNFLTREEYKKHQQGQLQNFWYNPVTNGFYSGETIVKGQYEPTYETHIFDRNDYLEAKSLKDAGRLDKDELPYKGWKGEFLDRFTERIQMKEAGVHTNAQYADIDTTTFMNSLVNAGSNIRTFTIPDAVTNIATNGLEYELDVYSRFNISQDVPEGVAPWAKRGSITTVSYDLTKDAGHAAWTDEAVLKARQNISQNAIDNIATDFRRSKSAKIADVLEGADETNSADWDAYSSGISSNNAIEDIRARLRSINASNGTADTIISSDTGYYAFAYNTFVNPVHRGNNSPNQGVSASARNVSFDILPGVNWFIDNELTETSVIVMDKRGVVCVNGPTRVGNYRSEDVGITGYVARSWYQCKRVVSDWVDELTTVTA